MVRVAGQRPATLFGADQDEFRRAQVGYVWQPAELGLWPALTALENVELAASGATGLLEAFGLSDREGRRPPELSQEERQRLALAVALANRPRLLLADEPAAGLEEAAANVLLANLADVLRRLGTSAVIVAPAEQIEPYVDRLVTIREAHPAVPHPARDRRAERGARRPRVLMVEDVTHWLPGSDGAPIVRDASFWVGEGEVVSILGRSGCAISALLAVCGGLEEPEAGRVTIAGQPVSGLSRPARTAVMQSKVGWVLRGAPAPSLTVEESVSLAARIGGAPRKEAVRLARAALEATDLLSRSRSPVSLLSSGEQLRAALARALARAPALIIADEPTAGLDARTASGVLSLVREAADTGIAVLLAARDPAVAEIADRVLVLSDGAIRERS
jgi:putative ABC transport system ATP-binding protein